MENKNYTMNFHNFLAIYNLLLSNFSNRNGFYSINIFHLDNNFFIEFINNDTNTIIYQDNFQCSLQEGNFLIYTLGNEFIQSHRITLPLIEPMQIEGINYYYKKGNKKDKEFDFYNAKTLRLKNDKFELNIYYFNGLDEIAIEMQEKGMKKLSDSFNTENEKVYTKQL